MYAFKASRFILDLFGHPMTTHLSTVCPFLPNHKIRLVCLVVFVDMQACSRWMLDYPSSAANLTFVVDVPQVYLLFPLSNYQRSGSNKIMNKHGLSELLWIFLFI